MTRRSTAHAIARENAIDDNQARRQLPDRSQVLNPSRRRAHASLRGVSDLVLEMAGLMIATKLAQRRLVQLKQDLAQLLRFRITGRETLPVNLAQGAHQGIAMLVADFAILVAGDDCRGRLYSCCSPLCPRQTASSRREQLATGHAQIAMEPRSSKSLLRRINPWHGPVDATKQAHDPRAAPARTGRR